MKAMGEIDSFFIQAYAFMGYKNKKEANTIPVEFFFSFRMWRVVNLIIQV